MPLSFPPESLIAQLAAAPVAPATPTTKEEALELNKDRRLFLSSILDQALAITDETEAYLDKLMTKSPQ